MNRKIPALCTLVIMIIAGMFAVSAVNEDTDAYPNYSTGSSSSPLTSVDMGFTAHESDDATTYYVKVGAPFKVYGAAEPQGGALRAVKVTGVTSGFGLSYSEGSVPSPWGNLGIVEGTVSASGTITVSMTAYLRGVDGNTGDYTIKFITVGSLPSYSHTIKYDANGGTGSMADTVLKDANSGSSNVTLASNSFTRSGYLFAGWKVGDLIYNHGDTISVSAGSSVTAVAQWTPKTYTHSIDYYGNGASGATGSTVVKDTNSGNSDVTFATNEYVKTGYHFVGWKIGAIMQGEPVYSSDTIYQPGDKIAVAGNKYVCAIAQWEINSLSIVPVPTQYAVVGKNMSFTVSTTSEPSGAFVTYVSGASGLNITINGSTITCSAATAGTYTFTLTASASGFQSDSRTVTVVVVPVLAFANTPAIGVIGA